MKNIIIVALTFAVLALGGYVYNLKQQIAPPSASETQVATLTKPAAPEPEPVVPPAIKPVDEFPDPDSFFDTSDKEGAATEQLKKAHDLIAALHQENQVLEEETQPDIFKGIKQIMESPEVKNMVRAGMGNDVKRNNAALFRWLQLDPEQESAVSELLIEQGIEEIGTGIQWMSGNIQESSQRRKISRDAMHAALEELVGPEKLEVYKYFEDTKNERDSVARFNRRLGDQALDDNTSDELVGMMYDTRGDFADLDYLSKPENYNPREMNDGRQQEVLDQVEQMHTRYVENAANILTPEQLPEYESNLNRQRKQLEGFMKFSHNMINRRDQAASPQE